MKFFSATAILATVFLVCWTDQQLDSWEGEQQEMANNLVSSCAAASQFTPLQEWDDLPANVQQYLNQAVGSSNSKATALSIEQEGEFLMKKDQYVPFTAKEVFAQNPPGFSWEGKIGMAPYAPSWFPKLFVSDSWVEGLGHFTAAVQAIVPVLQTSTNKELEEQMALGQAARWLADAVLLPSTLQPSSGMVTWKFLSDEKAILEMPIANIRGLQLEATFDSSTGLLTQVTGSKPFLKSGNDFEMKTWQVNFMDYQKQTATSGMMVPMKMESGWINEEGDFEAHYKIDNKSLQYIDVSDTESS